MNAFEYPFDTKELLGKKKRIKKMLTENLSKGKSIQKRIAILGGSTTNEIKDQLDLFLLYHGIQAEFYQSEYGKFWEDAVFDNEELASFKPDVIYIHTNWRNIVTFPSVTDSVEDVERKIENEYSRFHMMWDKLQGKYKCPIIQNNFERPNYRLLGNMDIYDHRGRSSFIQNLNHKLYNYARCNQSFFINDLDFLASDYGVTAWNDSKIWSLYKYAMPLDAIPAVASSVSNIIKAIYGKNKKLLALDLDNTLWGGVIGDDGLEGIEIGPETSVGEIYYEFQEYCKGLKDVGVILAINSKNDESNALLGLNHKSGVLKEEDFVSIKANWNPKNQNFIEMSSELSLGLDSFVFVDDNPAEREIVTQQSQGVSVINANEVDSYLKMLDHSGYFEAVSLSNEDVNKTKLYYAKAEANKLLVSTTDYGEYLTSLQMTAVITDFENTYIPRIAQLTNKSNQFNLTTLRLNEDDVKRMNNDGKHICLCGRLIDKFVDNGIVAISIGEIEEDTLHIRLWLMSCRVLKREMEFAMMNKMMRMAREKGIQTVVGYYFPTTKNSMVKSFYEQFGFECVKNEPNGNTVWKIDAERYMDLDVHMILKENGMETKRLHSKRKL